MSIFRFRWSLPNSAKDERKMLLHNYKFYRVSTQISLANAVSLTTFTLINNSFFKR